MTFPIHGGRCLRPVVLAAMAAGACAFWAVRLVGAEGEVDLSVLEERAFRAAVDRVAPSVVRVETVGGLQRVDDVLFGNGPTTGLIVDPDGYIVSSAFNFANLPSQILVRLPNGELKPADLVARDHSRMLVLLKIAAEQPLPVPEIAPLQEMRVGQSVIAVGRTFEGNRPNMSVGILSAKGRVWGKAIQTDAIVSPSNYGGPLLDIHGRVMGVIVPLAPDEASEVAGAQWYDSGIGFAIDAEHVMKVLPRLKKGEDLRPGLIGISLKGANPSIGQPEITACRPNSPAAKAGLKTGDRIVEIDGRPIQRAAGVREALSRHYAGEKVHLAVLRKDDRIEADVELVAELVPFEHPFLGILPMRDPDSGPGAAIRYVYPNSPAAAAGIVPGDRIVSLGGEPIKDRDELLGKIDQWQPDAEVALEVQRGQETLKLGPKLGRLPEDLPPPELPPARGALEPAAGELPDVGRLTLKVPEFNSDASAYVPETYHPAVKHGVVVWLHAPGGFDADKLLSTWKPLCDRHDLIVLVPKAEDPERWRPTEVEFIRKLLDQVLSNYAIDPARVVIHGQEGGGTLAFLVALGHRDLIRAVAVVDAPMPGLVPENEPLRRLAIYVAMAEKSAKAAAMKRAVTRLREMKIPVTLRDLGQDPRSPSPEELAELARWIDMLDRI